MSRGEAIYQRHRRTGRRTTRIFMTAGPRGPALLQDIWLIEKLAHFDREVIPERRMHAKGWGAYGTFTVTHDITNATPRRRSSAPIGKQTPMFVRFSTVAGERGAADAERDIRGTALKFYTEEGNWDIVGNNTPVFFFRDPLRFPDLNHAIKRDPRTGLRSADNNWDFWTLLPEALHQVTIVMSDRGIPKSFRHMHLFGSHTFSMINAANERVWVKFHFRTQQGIQNLTDADAARVVANDRESHGRDLLEAIDSRRFPALDALHPGDDRRRRRKSTSTIPSTSPRSGRKADYPLIEVGVVELNRYPDNYFAEVEQAAFSPANVVPGIGFSPDKMLQGAALLLWRHAALPAGCQLQPYPGERAEMPVPKLSSRRRRCAPTAIWAVRSTYQPNSEGLWSNQPDFTEPPMPFDGDGGALGPSRGRRPLGAAGQPVPQNDSGAAAGMLFENTARAMGDAGRTSSSGTSRIAREPIRPMARVWRARWASTSCREPRRNSGQRRNTAAAAHEGGGVQRDLRGESACATLAL